MNVLLQKYQGTIHLDQLKMYMVFVATVLTKINKLHKILPPLSPIHKFEI